MIWTRTTSAVAVPRFADENLTANLTVVDKVTRARRRQGRHAGTARARLGPAPGGCRHDPRHKRRKYLEENVAAVDVELTEEDLAALDEAAPVGVAAGDRYPEAALKGVTSEPGDGEAGRHPLAWREHPVDERPGLAPVGADPVEQLGACG